MKTLIVPILFAALGCVPGTAQKNVSGSAQDASLPDAPSAKPTYVSTESNDDQVSLKGFPKRFLHDEAGIFTSPLRMQRTDLEWLIPLAGATAASLSTDSYVMRNVVSRDTSFNNAAATTSDVLRGAAIGVPVLMLGVGQLRHDGAMRNTSVLAGEAMVDAYAFDEVIKFATLRERPNIQNARGHFWSSDAVADPSFISGHSIVAWSSAAVLASEYNRPWQQAAVYTLATGVSITRVLSQNHFPTDVLLGSAAGWLIGRYVFRSHMKDARALRH